MRPPRSTVPVFLAAFLAFAAAALCLAAPARADWVRRVTDGIMGTRITVELWADDKDKGERAIDAVLDEMRHIDESMSTYKPTSEVSQVNAKAADGPMPITKELFDLLTKAKEYSVLTEGAFDITYASVGYLYDFRKRVRPNEAQITKALPAVDYRHVLLDAKNRTVQFSQKGVRIDLGGIAKGFAIDVAMHALKRGGCTQAVVNAGGDLRRFGLDAQPIYLRRRAGLVKVAELRCGAIATSAPHVDHPDRLAQPLGSIFDPHDKQEWNGNGAVMVAAPSCVIADAFTKVAALAGPASAPLLARFGAKGLWDTDPDTVRENPN